MNNKLNSIKLKVKSLTNKFNYTDEQINLITLAYYAFITFDSNIKDLLDEVISSIEIIFTENFAATLNSLLSNLSPQEMNGYGICSGLSLIDDYDFKNYEWHKKPYIIIDTNNSGPRDILSTLIHEIKHKINAVIPELDLKHGFYHYGLSYRFSDKTLQNFMIDEAFNEYLVTIYMKIIDDIDFDSLDDKHLLGVIDALKKDSFFYNSYQSAINYCMPFFQSKKIFKLLYDASIYKKTDKLEHEIGIVFNDPYAYSKFARALDAGDDTVLVNMLNSLDYTSISSKRTL